MGDDVWWNGRTTHEVPPDQVLDRAIGKLDQVVIIGFDKEGNEYFASSQPDGGNVLWHLARAQKRLLEMPDVL